MTLEGARKALRQSRSDEVSRDAELAERLQRIRALLVEVREDLKETDGEVYADRGAAADEPAGEPAPKRGRKAVVKIAEEGGAEPERPVAKPARKPRRKKSEEPEHKELFAFYEQSLF